MNAFTRLLRRLANAPQALRSKSGRGVRPVCTPSVEALEDRLVPTLFTTNILTTSSLYFPGYLAKPGTAAWFQYNFQDAGLRNLAQTDFTRDGAITRNDMIGLFNQVEAEGGVSAAAFSDLKFLVSNLSALKAPDYVQYLAAKVVNGDPGNSTYQFIQPQYSIQFTGWYWSVSVTDTVAVAPLGNLHSGSSLAQLQELVNKWFLGMDLPTTTINNGNGTTSTFDYGYDSVANPFGQGAATGDYSDIHQGDVGDCWLMSAAAEVAQKSPSTLYNMFIDNGDGTFTIRFHSGGQSVFVTVNRWLPENYQGNFVFANTGQSLSDAYARLWAPLLEKAYAQLNHSGLLGRDGSNSYQGLTVGNPGDAMPVITGWGATVQNSLDQTAFDNAVSGGYLVTLLSLGSASDGVENIDGFNIVANHEYAVVGYDSTDGTYTLFNPWGFGTSGQADEEITVTWSQITDIFLSYDQGTNPANVWLTRITAPSSVAFLLGGGAGHQTGAEHGATDQVFATTPATHLDDLRGLTDILAENLHRGHRPGVDTLSLATVDGFFTETL
jgi:hypothetical protein